MGSDRRWGGRAYVLAAPASSEAQREELIRFLQNGENPVAAKPGLTVRQRYCGKSR